MGGGMVFARGVGGVSILRGIPARRVGGRGFSATIFSMPEPRRTMPDAKKYSVAVTAHSTYLPDQSDEEEDRYVFAYTIRITNNGSVSAQLVSRHWIITDADNQVQEVRGMGVVGEQPVLKPGDTFEYSSGSSIPTAVGTMRGSYQLVAEDGTRFEASIPEFTLSVPRVLH
jgi:ApaG protein